jgi:hypothetical protein
MCTSSVRDNVLFHPGRRIHIYVQGRSVDRSVVGVKRPRLFLWGHIVLASIVYTAQYICVWEEVELCSYVRIRARCALSFLKFFNRCNALIVQSQECMTSEKLKI